MKAKSLPCIDLIKSRLNYDYSTGIFSWKVNMRGHIKKGHNAGYISNDGYYVLTINGKRYGAHRIAWLLHYEKEPDGEIDHINRVRSDCRIENLRDVTRTQNANNRSLQSNNTSGFTGVSWNKILRKWTSSVQIKGKSIHLGYFDTPEEASVAYIDAKRKHHEGCTI